MSRPSLRSARGQASLMMLAVVGALLAGTLVLQRAPWASPRSRLTSWERRRLLRAGLGSSASS
jgi:hypothetical protein